MILSTHGIVGSQIVQLTGILLDDYPNAAAAYSLRKLRAAYTGSAIRVRRASDNAEQDIGFVTNVLDTATLTTFCSGTNGFVKTWYDQSGNGRDATQTTAANQPQIVSSGSVLTLNGNIGINFNSANNNALNCGVGLYIGNIRSYYCVHNVTGASPYRTIFCNSYRQTDSIYVGFNATSYALQNWVQNENVHTANITYTNGIQYLLDGFYETGTNGIKRYVNNNLDTQYTTSKTLTDTATTTFSIGGDIADNDYWYQGIIQELVFYTNANTSNRTGIETNINSYYSIY